MLVDEYDNPLLKNIGENEEQEKANRTLYKGFFAVLKDCDAYLRFAFFTGVTKFSKVSIFSDLNQLNDITLNKRFDAICGITQEELEANFKPEISAMAENNGMTFEACRSELKRMYDGYHFCMNSPDIYNPFSLLRAFDEKKFGFPNDEVKYGFLDALAPSYLHVEDKPAPFNVDILDDAVEEGDADGIRKWFTALFALLPYTADAENETLIEQNFQNVIYISLLVLGKYVRTEVH